MSFVIIHTFPPTPKKYQSMNGLFVKKSSTYLCEIEQNFCHNKPQITIFSVLYFDLIFFFLSFLFHNCLIKLDFWNWLQILRKKCVCRDKKFPKTFEFCFFPTKKSEKKPDIFILKHSYVKNNGKESKKLCTLLATNTNQVFSVFLNMSLRF